MNLTAILREAKLLPADARKVKELHRTGMPVIDALGVVIEDARKDLESVREALIAKGYAVEVQRIEKKKETA